MTLSARLDDDLTIMINTDEFALDITVKGNPVQAIFDNAFFGLSMEGDTVAVTKPQCMVKTSDIAAFSVVQGDAVVVNSVNYKVETPQPDGTGVTTLILVKV